MQTLWTKSGTDPCAEIGKTSKTHKDRKKISSGPYRFITRRNAFTYLRLVAWWKNEGAERKGHRKGNRKAEKGGTAGGGEDRE